MEEFVDVLDEKGRYTGKIETRDNCYKKGLWHKSVCLFIINSKEQVLLQKRSPSKKTWPNMWDVTVGGNVLAGELGFQAIIRECKEELGIELNKNEITFIGSVISNKNNNYFNEYYVANREININELHLQEEEVSEVKWIDKDEIIRKIKNNYDGITDKEGCWEYLIKYYEIFDDI